ncbi:MAG: MBL fold metallo-hydrolase, partial [Fimbriimonadaceae bacterium]|nr:MBL fold metallo-hydrolase [Fimbriimonadaceae bacterium]
MILKSFWNEPLSQWSYLVGCPASGESIVIDPDRDIDRYLAVAQSEGVRITKVTETHIHADYLSGARELAYVAEAELLLSGEGGPDWTYAYDNPFGTRILKDGDVITVGGGRLVVMHTPGHTPEHISFVLEERAGTPLGAFTGDFVFVGDVGRPDLLENAAGIAGTAEPGARNLYRSITKFAGLPDRLIVWPAHGAGSSCGKALGGIPVSTLGYEKATSWAWSFASEDEFVGSVLDGQPEAPTYFAKMKHLNKVGPGMVRNLPKMHRLWGADALTEAEADQTLVLDVRPSADYLKSHRKGSLHIPLYGGFVNYAGWLIGYDQDIVLVAANQSDAEEAQRRLRLIGIDRVVGWVGADAIAGKTAAGSEILASELGDDDYRVDIRGRNERVGGRNVPKAAEIPLGVLPRSMDSLPVEETIYVVCESGVRAPIACSVLER